MSLFASTKISVAFVYEVCSVAPLSDPPRMTAWLDFRWDSPRHRSLTSLYIWKFPGSSLTSWLPCSPLPLQAPISSHPPTWRLTGPEPNKSGLVFLRSLLAKRNKEKSMHQRGYFLSSSRMSVGGRRAVFGVLPYYVYHLAFCVFCFFLSLLLFIYLYLQKLEHSILSTARGLLCFVLLCFVFQLGA